MDRTLYQDDTEGSGPLKCRASFFSIKVLMPAHLDISGWSRCDSIRVKCWNASIFGPLFLIFVYPVFFTSVVLANLLYFVTD
ncbi:uncharacterized protein METZ01_LOCUS1235 [marine metagenome]|uniref:Uncharacterized protein n=1 Tax=marine metagenome TaxID=408172 RepID=A0A381N1C8_9ZZZZ